jgi:hypothetical protein
MSWRGYLLRVRPLTTASASIAPNAGFEQFSDSARRQKFGGIEVLHPRGTFSDKFAKETGHGRLNPTRIGSAEGQA